MSEAQIAAQRLSRRRRAAAAVLWTERLLPALAPSAGIAVAFLSAAFLGVTAAAPPEGQTLLLAAAIATAGGLGVHRARRVAPPREADVDRRLEQSAGAIHRPLSTLSDRPAWGGTDAVWRAHRDRAVIGSAALRAGGPQFSAKFLGGSAGALASLVASIWAAGPAGPERLRRALLPFDDVAMAAPARLQAWLVPPTTTRLPPVFLQAAEAPRHAIPLGSHLFVSVIGSERPPALVFAGQRQKFRRLDHNSFQAELPLNTSGSAEVWRRLHRIAHWDFQVAADQPPRVRLAGTPSIAAGRAVVPWQASDDFGIASIRAVLTLADVPEASARTVDLQIEGTPRSARGGTLPDLTDSSWAGLPVHLRWIATDTAGQRGESAEVGFGLPERLFLNPLARALQGIRRDLVLTKLSAAGAAAALDRLSVAAAAAVPRGQWLYLRAAAALLIDQPKRIEEAEARLWRLALAIEDAGVTDARQRLSEIRAQLRDALAAPASPIQQERVEALTRALTTSLRSYLQALARQADQGNNDQPARTDDDMVDAGQIVQMAADLADAAKAGRRTNAGTQLQRLGALLDRLRSAQVAHQGQTGSSKRTSALDHLAIDQDRLGDHTAARLSASAAPDSAVSPGTKTDAIRRDKALERRIDLAAQDALRRKLGDLVERLGEVGLPIPDALARADGAMRSATESLSGGSEAAARAAQQRASEALHAAARQLADGGARASRALAAEQQPGGEDPFGRRLDGSSAAAEPQTAPLDGDSARSRPLRDELRRRAADRARRQQELDYFDRLLNAE